ncbi:C-terminal processing protease CtpA/Prc [Pedobacter cryoconitis]|uniref:C-terminal processing protease CtpA/Prc n=1 Tax=Pedobacter cryoconitis TaxID=188932 RepID=A0A7W8YWN3_9SPHI|nr:S41 family peptidase [Pedobacter cryoconitis]MBB5623027.1 C-terminal processing protease CtpA/Prc [Pedobacter cryoconitis]
MENREEPIRSTVSNVFPSFKILDKETNLLVLPSFSIRYKEKVDSVIKQNKDLLGNSKHLIIDIRNNQGGTTTTYEELLPYIYTNPIYTTTASILATTDNINGLYHPDMPGLSEVTRKKFKESIRKMNEHKNEFYPLYPPDTIRLAHVLKNPQRISILINGESASAAEIMILNYRQSKKVTLFGQNSSGAIDYVDVLQLKIPCSYFSILYPAVRYNSVDTKPLNNIGIAPHVIISDQVKDWVEYVRIYKAKK